MSLIGQTKSFASLSSTLLARKGQARPAMRPQGFPGFGHVAEVIDDLGWNDMGHAEAAPSAPLPAVVPPVLRQREVLREEIEAPEAAPEIAPAPVLAPEPAPVPASAAVPVAPVPVAVAPVVKPRAAVGSKAKAAFTLRLDHDRHLRLRLASALANRSAQQLVTQALDTYLQSLPEVEGLANQAALRADTDLDMGD